MNGRGQPQPLIDRTAPTSSGEVWTQSPLLGPGAELSGFSHRSSNGLERSVELHIEEVVLHGFDPANRYAIGEAIERELTRLFSEQGATTAAIRQDGKTARLDRGAFEMRAGSNAETLGMQVARAIYGGFDQ